MHRMLDYGSLYEHTGTGNIVYDDCQQTVCYAIAFAELCGADFGAALLFVGSVTALEFYAESHLLSASDDGLICVWRTTDWLCMTRLKGHK